MRPLCRRAPCTPQRISGAIHYTHVVDADGDRMVAYCDRCGNAMTLAALAECPKVVPPVPTETPRVISDPAAVAEALSLFQASRWWSIGGGGCSVYLANPEQPRSFGVKTQVRLKAGESLADMIVRCAALARKRLAEGWTPPPQEKKERPGPRPEMDRAIKEAKTLPFKRMGSA